MRERYSAVLVLSICSFGFALTAPDRPWAASVLLALLLAAFVFARWAAGKEPSLMVAALGVLGVLVAIVNLTAESDATTVAIAVTTALLTLATIIVVARGMLAQGKVNHETIRGALTVYLLLGLCFTFLYGALAVLDSDPFFAQGTDGSRSLRAYFSYTTLATLGYGDYTAAGSLGRAFSMTEALLGQLYLVTVVALLVSRLGSSRRDDDRPTGPSETRREERD